MRIQRLSCLIVICAVNAGACSQSRVASTNGRLPTLSEKLQDYHIGLTRKSLLEALKNSVPEVRGLAAGELAGEGAAETIPSIIEALKLEKEPNTRVNIAFALTVLGEERGFTELKNICHDAKRVSFIRIEAASYLVRQNDCGCLKSVISILNSKEHDSRAYALDLLPKFKSCPKNDASSILKIFSQALADPQPSVRLSASIAIGEWEDTSAIPYLQKAMSVESDGTVLSRMKDALKRLQDKRNWPDKAVRAHLKSVP